MILFIILIAVVVAAFLIDNFINFDDFSDWLLNRRSSYDKVFTFLMWIISDGWWFILTLIHYMIVKRKGCKND